MTKLIQIVLIILVARYLWRLLKKYIPKIEDINQQQKKTDQSLNIKLDKSDIEDAEFKEVDDKN